MAVPLLGRFRAVSLGLMVIERRLTNSARWASLGGIRPMNNGPIVFTQVVSRMPHWGWRRAYAACRVAPVRFLSGITFGLEVRLDDLLRAPVGH